MEQKRRSIDNNWQKNIFFFVVSKTFTVKYKNGLTNQSNQKTYYSQDGTREVSFSAQSWSFPRAWSRLRVEGQCCGQTLQRCATSPSSSGFSGETSPSSRRGTRHTPRPNFCLQHIYEVNLPSLLTTMAQTPMAQTPMKYSTGTNVTLVQLHRGKMWADRRREKDN